ncbi:MerR family transcriptional regulator [Bacillus pseudomycoides]|nr:MerR family transcriptional regulator [Bacillus pseudomycoides]
MQERSFWTKEVAERLEIGTSTLRKWCISLEQENYSFVKGAKNSRAFVQKDIQVLEQMKKLIQEAGMSIESAVKVVLSVPFVENEEDKISEKNSRTPSVLPENTIIINQEFIEKLLQEQILLKEKIQQLERIELMNAERLERMENRYDERDSLLLTHVREIQETKRLIAASQNKEEKKWWKFWE